MRFIVRLVWAFIFFAMFAFTLNNEQDVVVHWFFGAQWKTPMVIVVLVAFASGAALGVMAMVPAWWRHRRVARRHAPAPPPPPRRISDPPTVAPSEFGPEHPPREGL